MNINQQLKENRVLPLATITSKEEVDGISHALLKANCSVLEITLRDDRVRKILHLFKDHPDLTIVLGTIRSSEDIDLAVSSGVRFGNASAESRENTCFVWRLILNLLWRCCQQFLTVA